MLNIQLDLPLFSRWLENNYARVPDYKEEQERFQWIQREEGVVNGGGGGMVEEEGTNRVERSREENEMLYKGEEEDLRLRREERESRELEKTLKKFKEEDARNQLRDNEEEEQIYEQLDNYNQEPYYELNKERFASLKITDEPDSRPDREHEKGPDPPERGKSLKLEINKIHPEHDEKLYVALSCLGGSIKKAKCRCDEPRARGAQPIYTSLEN